MKKIYFYVLLFAVTIIFSCKKSEDTTVVDSLIPIAKQYAFMAEETSTTCGTCGSIGHENFNLAKKTNSGKIIALAFHCNGPSDAMQSSLLFSYENSRPALGGGIPAFYIGDTEIDLYSLQPSIDSLLRRTPEAGVKFTSKIVGNVMQVTAKIKFFKQVTGDYYVSFYLCENGIDGSPTAAAGFAQTSASAGYTHCNVVRSGNVTSNAYGVKITKAATTASGTVYDYTCNINIDPFCVKNNLFVTSAIWKANSDINVSCHYMFVNGWDSMIY